MSLSVMILLGLAVCSAVFASIQERSTATQTEIATLRGLVAKIVSETEAMKASLAVTNANVNTINANVNTIKSTLNSRMDKLTKVTQQPQQCEMNADNYVRYAILDCVSNDIDIFYEEGISLQDCINRCNVFPLCMAFYYHGAHKKCYVKSKCEVSSLIPHDAGDLYIKKAVSFYDHIREVHCNGNDIKNIPNYTAEKCADECNKDMRCVGFVMNVVANICWMKHKCESSSLAYDDSLDTYIHKERKDIPGFVRKPKEHCPGNDIWSHYVNAENCAKGCQRNSQCVAIEFWYDKGYCYHKKSCGSPRQSKDVTVVYDKQ